ncbi:hypothetical protein ABIG06_006874 [Bradyrhizobium sp. USDA 326]
MRHFAETAGPVQAAAGVDPDLMVGDVELAAVAVEFDFVDPALAMRHALDLLGENGLDEAGEGRLRPDRLPLPTLQRH